MQKASLALLSVIFPPLGVLLTRGLSMHLVINLVLTLCGWLPGLLHAWYHVLQAEIADPNAPCHAEPIEQTK